MVKAGWKSQGTFSLHKQIYKNHIDNSINPNLGKIHLKAGGDIARIIKRLEFMYHELIYQYIKLFILIGDNVI